MEALPADVDLGLLAPLIGVPARLRMLDALTTGEPQSVTQLARATGVSAATASEHLSRLRDGGLVLQASAGRLRLYRLASAEVATALEALARLSPPRPVRSLQQAQSKRAFALARTCYDHVAGRLGVALHDQFFDRDWLVADRNGYRLSDAGRAVLQRLGVDTAAAETARRAFARPCLDVTERRDHLAGALGAAICERFLAAGWLARRRPGDRAVHVTESGHSILTDHLAITL